MVGRLRVLHALVALLCLCDVSSFRASPAPSRRRVAGLRVRAFEEVSSGGEEPTLPGRKRRQSRTMQKRELNKSLEMNKKLPAWERKLREQNRERAQARNARSAARKRSRSKVATFRARQQHFEEKWRKEAEVLQVAKTRDYSTPLEEVVLERPVDGKVLKLERFGAWVDIGAEVAGLMHIKDIRADKFVEYVRDEVQVGDAITVYPKYVNTDAKKLGLRGYSEDEQYARGPQADDDYIPMDQRIPVADIPVGLEVTGRVVKLSNFGAYVDIGSTSTAFLHINAWPHREPGSRPHEAFEVGETLKAIYVEDVDTKKNRIKLTGHKQEWAFTAEEYSDFAAEGDGGDADVDVAALEAEAAALESEFAVAGQEGEGDDDDDAFDDGSSWTFTVGPEGDLGLPGVPLPDAEGAEEEQAAAQDEGEFFMAAEDLESFLQGDAFEEEEEEADAPKPRPRRHQDDKDIDMDAVGGERASEVVVHDFEDEFEA